LNIVSQDELLAVRRALQGLIASFCAHCAFAPLGWSYIIEHHSRL